MAKFNASRAVTGLEFDLNPHVRKTGTIPEPSDEMIARYSKEMAEFSVKYDLRVDPTNPRKVAEAAAALTEEDMLEAGTEQARIHAELCSQSPTEEDLMALPPRVRNAFYGWLQESFNPEV